MRTSLSPFPVKEEGTERVCEPEVMEDQMKQSLLDVAELMNSRQP